MQSLSIRHVCGLDIALEPDSWDALTGIAICERIGIEALCALVLHRLAERQRRRGDVNDMPGAMASALVALAAAYYRHASALDARPIGPLAAAYRTVSAPPSEEPHSKSAIASAKSA